MNHLKARKLAREITALFAEQDAVVLGTNDIQEFLSDGQPVDSVAAMEIIRDIADEHRWEAFVYDYGALVRFTRKPGTALNGDQPAPNGDRQTRVKA
jgi:hypothetical protein